MRRAATRPGPFSSARIVFEYRLTIVGCRLTIVGCLLSVDGCRLTAVG